MTTFLNLPPDREVTSRFGRRPFALQHELVAHPLIQPEALAELADSLPPQKVEHNSGQLDAVTPAGEVPQADLSPAEIVRTIETNNCWIVLPIHQAPAYRELCDALFDEVRPHLPAGQGDIVQRQAVFFLATGGSTTPTHIDLEHGLLLHLRGEKEVQVGRFPDAQTAQQKIERMHLGEHRNLAQPPQDPARFQLQPGDGVHIPAFTPHLVHTAGGQVSLSLTIAMKTEMTMRESAVHRANGHLRRLGMNPRQPGVNPRSDRVKHKLVAARAAALSRRAS
jgi:ribosomal protein L16 Arg81 hydroxylase